MTEKEKELVEAEIVRLAMEIWKCKVHPGGSVYSSRLSLENEENRLTRMLDSTCSTLETARKR